MRAKRNGTEKSVYRTADDWTGRTETHNSSFRAEQQQNEVNVKHNTKQYRGYHNYLKTEYDEKNFLWWFYENCAEREQIRNNVKQNLFDFNSRCSFPFFSYYSKKKKNTLPYRKWAQLKLCTRAFSV